MEPQVDNSALRLHGILKELTGGRYDNSAVGEALSSVTGFPPARAFARIYQLFEDVRAGVLAIEPVEYGEATTSLIEPIEEWMSGLDMRQAWKNGPDLPRHAIVALLTCSSALARGRSLLAVADDQLEGLGVRVEELRHEVYLASGLAQELRIFLLRHLDDMYTALREYRLMGSGVLVDSVDLATGDFASSRSVPQTDEEETLWRKFVGVARDIKEVAIAAGLAGGIVIGAGQYVADAYDVLRDSAPHIGAPLKELPSGARYEVGRGNEGADPEPQP